MSLRVIDPRDNVAVQIGEGGAVPSGHKVARRAIAQGEFVIKYGEIIGRATQDIAPGEWVHTHNLRSHLDEGADYHYQFQPVSLPPREGSFWGYPRPWGDVGIRNEIYILPTVGCVNPICQRLAQEAQSLVGGSLDGIFALPHQFGCSQLGEDGENIQKLLCSIALNPNASFVLFVGLGCENNSLEGIRQALSPFQRDNMAFLNCQEAEDELAAGLEILKGFAEKARGLRREQAPLSKLRIGLKCGGSDGYSGLTANPLVGQVTDWVIAAGGSAVLTEVPEMFGAEGFLMDRCIDRDVFVKAEQMINGFKEYFISHNEVVYDNPSPGNKQGGITTLEDKSCGCVQKGGTAPIMDVIGYGDPVVTKGLNMLYGPGNDLVSATAMTAAGAHLILFSTGRGTPFSAPAPTLKISTNTPLAEKKAGWIDFNTGVIADGEKTIDEAAKDLLDLVIRVAGGEQTKAEKHGFREISIFKDGVVL